MKNSKESHFTDSVPKMLLLATVCVIIDVVYDKFGTFSFFSKGGKYHNMELMGIFIPLLILILPIFVKKFRKEFWSKRNLMLTFAVLIISIILITIIYANKYYYRSYWIDISFLERQRSDAPPIRWDIWNIINKQYPE